MLKGKHTPLLFSSLLGPLNPSFAAVVVGIPVVVVLLSAPLGVSLHLRVRTLLSRNIPSEKVGFRPIHKDQDSVPCCNVTQSH